MSHCQLFYHIVWATKHRASYLTEEVETEVYGLLRAIAAKQKAHLFALNGMPDHVHLVVSLPPTMAVSTLLGRLKGASSTLYNKTHLAHPIFWQNEYAAFSCDAHCLQRHIAYVRNQKEHHRQGATIDLLECINPADADR